MRVTTEILGNEATVVVEDEGTGANAVRTDTVTVDDNGRLTYAAFAGKTIDFIKRYFRGDVDGTNIIGRNSTTLFSDGVLTVGTFLAGQSVNILQLGETFYTSDAKVFADNAETAATQSEAARDEILAKIPFDALLDGQYIRWNEALEVFEGTSVVASVDWGGIGGTLSDQTDLQNALNAKQDDITLTTTGTSGPASLVGSTLNIPNYEGDTFPAANEFDLYQKGATDPESISREDLGKQSQLFTQSFVKNGYEKGLWVYDNVIRNNTTVGSGNIGSTTSGLAYNTLGTTLDWYIVNNRIATESTGFAVVDRNGLGVGSCMADVYVNFSAAAARDLQFVFARDVDNLFTVFMTGSAIQIIKRVAGVETIVASQTISSNNYIQHTANKKIDFKIFLYYRDLATDRLGIQVTSEALGNVVLQYSESTADINTIFPTEADVRYVGFRKTGVADLSDIFSWAAYNLEK